MAVAGAQPGGGLVVSVLEENVTATLRLLANEGRLEILSRPYVLASDNQLATITVGQEVPFITRSQLSDTGVVNNTIEYDDIGILLDVIPHINPDGLVILDVSDIQKRALNPQAKQVGATTWSSVTIPQAALPVTIGGKPYLVEIDAAEARVREAERS